MLAGAFAAACLLVPAIAAGAEAPGVVTLMEGPAALLRTAGRFALAEGVRVQAGDIVEVPDKGLVQIELAGGARLNLGPRSRFHVAALAGTAGRGGKDTAISDFYLLQGWTKLALGPKAGPLRITTPLFGFGSADAVVVVQVESAEASLFVERGALRLAEGFVKATPASPIAVGAGQFYVRRADQRGILQPRPAPAFVAGMPAYYRDNLPERLAGFKDRDVAPRRLGELTYQDVEPWLKGPPELRRPLTQRLRTRGQDPEFRQAVIANMRFHPEWDRILFPEKYLPKPPPSADAAKAPPTAADPAKAHPPAADTAKVPAKTQ
jgi:hypothetical protein